MGALEGKAAVVTGGGRGIGRAICLGYAKEGADVIVNYATRDQPALEVVDLIQKMGRKAVAMKGNVALRADAERIIQSSIDQRSPSSHNAPTSVVFCIFLSGQFERSLNLAH